MAECAVDARRLNWRLTAAGLAYHAHGFSRVRSTQELALAAAAVGVDEGAVFLADVQAEGRGRAGRRWLAPPATAVMFSAVLRPPRALVREGSLALAVGLAVAEGIERAGGPATELKWPNDCLIQGRKVAGVLVEVPDGLTAPAAVVGIGCNVAWRALAPSQRPPGAGTALDLEGPALDFGDVAFQLISSLDRRYRQWREGGFASMAEDWGRRLVWVGRSVEVDVGGLLVKGQLVGVDPEGRLRLRTGTGETLIPAGDLGLGEGGSVRTPSRHSPPGSACQELQ